MLNFKIDTAYLCNVHLKEDMAFTHEDVVYTGVCHRTEDHPKFAEVRLMLAALGFIYMETHWINGDRVLKGFNLNTYMFKEGDQFPCAAAMAHRIHPSKHNTEKICGVVESE